MKNILSELHGIQYKLPVDRIGKQFWLHRNGSRSFLTHQTLFTILSPRLTVKEGCVAFRSNSWASLWVTSHPYLTHKPSTWLFYSYFNSRFHPHTSYNSTRCAIYSTCERFCFHHSQNKKLHALPPIPIKLTSCTLVLLEASSFMHLLLQGFQGCT